MKRHPLLNRPSVHISITMPAELADRIDERAGELREFSRSAYLTRLIREDLERLKHRF